jgi:hypothetical protein
MGITFRRVFGARLGSADSGPALYREHAIVASARRRHRTESWLLVRGAKASPTCEGADRRAAASLQLVTGQSHVLVRELYGCKLMPGAGVVGQSPILPSIASRSRSA